MSEPRPLSDLDVIQRLQYARGRASDVENVTAAGRGAREPDSEGAVTQAADASLAGGPARREHPAEPPKENG